jgi:hypothetical protein
MVGLLFDITGNYLPGFILVFVMAYSLFVSSIFLPETAKKDNINSILPSKK